MTVKELIDKLSTLDPGFRVVTNWPGGGFVEASIDTLTPITDLEPPK